MTVSDEAMSAAFEAWYGYPYEWSNSQGDGMRRAIEAADRTRGGTLPMVPSAEAIDMALATCGFPITSLRRSRIREALAAAYAIDGAREKAGDWLEVFDEPSAQDAGGEGSSSVSALRALIHGFRNVTGNFGWCLVRRAELDAAMAELDALEK